MFSLVLLLQTIFSWISCSKFILSLLWILWCNRFPHLTRYWRQPQIEINISSTPNVRKVYSKVLFWLFSQVWDESGFQFYFFFLFITPNFSRIWVKLLCLVSSSIGHQLLNCHRGFKILKYENRKNMKQYKPETHFPLTFGSLPLKTFSGYF